MSNNEESKTSAADFGTDGRKSDQLIECPCGTVLRGEDLGAVVDIAQTHAQEVHDMDLSREQAESMARPS
jgi:hypothetical protein